MPKLVNITPKYRKHKQSGQAIVTLNGQDYLLGPHGTQASRREYDRLIVEWLSRGRQPLILAGVDLTLAELGARYCAHSSKKHVRNGKPTPQLYRIKGMLQHLLRLYDDRPTGEFSPRELKVVRQSMVDADWSRNYVNTQTGVLVRMFKWAAVEGLLPASVHATLDLVDGLRRDEDVRETEPIAPVEDATVDATLPHLPPVVADMVRLQRLTGC